MPLRAYEPIDKPCRLCGQGFELLETGSKAPLSICPTCGAPVRPVAAARANTPKITKPLSTSDARAAGFTVLKRTNGGEYEKQ